MRHFLNNIAAFIENNENDKALAHKRYARCNRKRAWTWYKKHQTDCWETGRQMPVQCIWYYVYRESNNLIWFIQNSRCL